MLIKQRSIIEYSPKEKYVFEKHKEIVNNYIQIMENNTFYPNQMLCSIKLLTKLLDRKNILLMVCGQTQSGKTGTMLKVIQDYITHPLNLIPMNNIYIISGISSKSWENQTKDRIPEPLQKNVYHRNKMKNFADDIRNKKNLLIIIDEVQIAAKEKQTISDIFKDCKFYDLQYLLENDIKIIQFSATPDGLIYNLNQLEDHSDTVIMTPGANYRSCFDLLEQGRIKQFKNLSSTNKFGKINIPLKELKKNFKEINDQIKKYNEPMYHIIRIKTGKLINDINENIRKYIKNVDIIENFEENKEDINDILEKKPNKHKIILVKEKLRCAKTISKKYLGILYERFTNSIQDSTIIQGLLGRATGYDDNGKTFIFTNIDTILRYKKIWNSEFKDIKSVDWKSPTLKVQNGISKIKSTFNNPSLFKGLSKNKDDNEKIKEENIVKIFDKYKEAKIYANKYFNWNPRLKKLDVDGFYINHIRGKKGKMSFNIIMDNIGWGINNQTNRRFHIGYEDTKDISSVKFIIVHKKK